MKWDLVPDRDAWTCHISAGGLVGSIGLFRMLWSFVLERKLTEPEVREILSKAHYGPVPYEHSWASVQRSECVEFWRTPQNIA